MPTLFLFDIDCTLLWTRGAGRAATRNAMMEMFGTAAAIEGHTFGGKTDWQTLVELLGEHGHDEATIGEAIVQYNDVMGRHLAAIIDQYEVTACPGALDLVLSLREHDDVLLGIVTGNVGNSAPTKLRAAGFDPAWFPVGAYGHEAMAREALPAIALGRAIEHYNIPLTANDVIVIGDTPADVACARALGACVVVVRTGFEEEAALVASQPDYLIDDLTQFASLELVEDLSVR